MKKQNISSKKNKKVKNIKLDTGNDEYELKSFLIILGVICLLVAGIYFLTEHLNKDSESISDIVTPGEINYDKVSVGTMLNRPYDKYYVLVYNSEDPNAVLYSAILSSYMQKDKEKIYFCDLANSLNKKYYDVYNNGKTNPAAQRVEEFNFGDLTLLTIEDSKITNYTEKIETIKGILK